MFTHIRRRLFCACCVYRSLGGNLRLDKYQNGYTPFKFYKNGKEIYNINKRSFKYGFATATQIESTEKVSNYITKYITKELITMSKGQHRYLYSKNLAKPQSETLFEEDLKFMELLLSKNKNLVKIKKVKDEERGIETTYITIKRTE